jgi:hypothetical protein
MMESRKKSPSVKWWRSSIVSNGCPAVLVLIKFDMKLEGVADEKEYYSQQ